MTLRFRQSSFCATGACVQVAFAPTGAVVVRDSKSFTQFSADPGPWRSFAEQVRVGTFVPRGNA